MLTRFYFTDIWKIQENKDKSRNLAPFVGKTIFFQWIAFASLSKISWLHVDPFLGSLFCPLIYLCLLSTMPHCLDYIQHRSNRKSSLSREEVFVSFFPPSAKFFNQTFWCKSIFLMSTNLFNYSRKLTKEYGEITVGICCSLDKW